ncbi:MAG: hypothetical protein H6Q20_1773 [Bacteroidetes bacterium]|nr:hypothetical protein [Bacteroidota bacterium]
MLYKTELLTTEELNSLKKELRSNYFTGVTFFVMVYMLTHLLFFVNTEKWIIPRFELLVMFGILFTTLLLTFILSRQLRKEIENGTKIIEYKIIEDKHSYTDRQDRLSKEFIKYVIIASGKKFTVTEELYKKAEISDYLLLHKTTEREIELKLEIRKTYSP